MFKCTVLCVLALKSRTTLSTVNRPLWEAHALILLKVPRRRQLLCNDLVTVTATWLPLDKDLTLIRWMTLLNLDLLRRRPTVRRITLDYPARKVPPRHLLILAPQREQEAN